MRVLVVSNHYNEFLESFYAAQGNVAGESYGQQLARLTATGFGVSDSYSAGFRAAGCEAFDVISNASPLQRLWAAEHDFEIPNVKTWHHDVLEAQVRSIRPDVLYVFEYNPIGDECLKRLKKHVRLLVGQIASNLLPHRTFDPYDLMISSWPPIVDYFHRHGRRGHYLPLGFDERILQRVNPLTPKYDLSFVGGLAKCHSIRIAFLEKLCQETDLHIFGYGLDSLPADSAIRSRHHGPVWGLEMYDVLRASKITLNVHAETDVRGQVSHRFANNMRLYEATGVGTCLLTEERDNLHTLFRPNEEVVTYCDYDDCVARIRELLTDDHRRLAIAGAGQARTLRSHTYTQRMAELKDILETALEQKASAGQFLKSHKRVSQQQ
ncbi:MAG: glycosyltransferase [Chloroflexi bacterium]|nr:glycosyltransferase [Chloroflexota bacterium]